MYLRLVSLSGPGQQHHLEGTDAWGVPDGWVWKRWGGGTDGSDRAKRVGGLQVGTLEVGRAKRAECLQGASKRKTVGVGSF